MLVASSAKYGTDRILDIFEYLGQVDCQNIVSSLVFSLVKWNKCLSGKQQQIKSKIIEKCKESQDPEDCSHFLPHHGVMKQDRETTKLRVVFDGSAKSSNDLSLNDCLQKGPNLVPHPFNTVIKFRGYPIGIIADMKSSCKVVRNYRVCMGIHWQITFCKITFSTVCALQC